jgi:shikimate dehydrogenase
MDVSGKTRVYGVIGDPIEHTLSPTLQNAAFKASGLDCTF